MLLCILMLSSLVWAQRRDVVQQADSLIVGDTAQWVTATPKDIAPVSKPIAAFKPNPKKAVIYSLVFPGLGQIYNRKYWKLPIVYGGFIGLTYAVSWNNTYYVSYRKAYRDITDDDDTTNSWTDFLSPSVDVSSLTSSQISSYATVFSNRKNYYRRYRDLSIICMVGLYALCAIDAYVDASLFDFNVSKDVSMHVEPAVLPGRSNKLGDSGIGVNCNITF